MAVATGSQPQSDLKHVAIIMDGNGRWAKARGSMASMGHKAGVERIRDVLRAASDNSVEVVTVFAFSSENWQRPPKEVEALMGLFLSYLRREAKKLKDEQIRVRIIGNRQRFSERIQKAMRDAEAIAGEGDRTLVIAADYGGKWDIANAAQQVAKAAVAGDISAEQIDETLLAEHLCLADLPPVDLLIRTGGELRISNFLLWQSAYAELYFSDVLWPDFDQAQFQLAVDAFYRRQRRFGGRLEEDNNNGEGALSAKTASP